MKYDRIQSSERAPDGPPKTPESLLKALFDRECVKFLPADFLLFVILDFDHGVVADPP
jgi:hypothetical protein